jgi:Domain of unknown function (DUF3402)
MAVSRSWPLPLWRGLTFGLPLLAPDQGPQIPLSLDEIDVIRHREITSKAVSAILLLVLKWFKVSRESSV